VETLQGRIRESAFFLFSKSTHVFAMQFLVQLMTFIPGYLDPKFANKYFPKVFRAVNFGALCIGLGDNPILQIV
jgi:hypothetical protein